jgi:hypothetical protein
MRHNVESSFFNIFFCFFKISAQTVLVFFFELSLLVFLNLYVGRYVIHNIFHYLTILFIITVFLYFRYLFLFHSSQIFIVSPKKRRVHSSLIYRRILIIYTPN